MKKQFCSIALSSLLAAGMTLGTASAFAQQTPPPDASGAPPAGRMGRAPMTPDEQLDRMTKRYNLSADQQTQIKPILADTQQQMMTLRQDSSMSREDKMAKMKTLHDGATSKISAVLNDTQKQQFNADQQRMQDRMMQRGGGAPAGGPPSQ
jgi:Spy/CpxP family protein refolding chaperone